MASAVTSPGERPWALAETAYPILRQVSASKESDVLRPRPDLGAALDRNRAWTGRDLVYGCMAYYPMMCAFMKDGAGLYIAAHDSTARIKALRISKEHDISFETPVENAGVIGKAAEGPRYDVTIAAFSGDWWSAAKLYRDWALTTPWAAKGPIAAGRLRPIRRASVMAGLMACRRAVPVRSTCISSPAIRIWRPPRSS